MTKLNKTLAISLNIFSENAKSFIFIRFLVKFIKRYLLNKSVNQLINKYNLRRINSHYFLHLHTFQAKPQRLPLLFLEILIELL